MNYQTIITETTEGIVTITLNRPKALNAVNKLMMSELNDYFSANYGDYTIRGVILTGSGEKAFVAGADIKEFSELTEEDTVDMSSYGHETYAKIENFHAPVIAAVNGFALGGGCELALACHIRIAAANAKFGLPEANLGLGPGYGGTQRLTQIIGKGRTFEYMFTTQMIDAERAYEIGLANKVVPEGEALSAAVKMMQKIKSKAPIALQEDIKSINATNPALGYKQEAKSFGKLMVTNDAKEGAAAFVEKRKAIFKAE